MEDVVLEPLLTSRFRVLFVGLGGDEDAYDLTKNVRTVNRPKIQFTERKNDKGEYECVGAKWDPLKITFYEFPEVMKPLMNQVARQMNAQEQGRPEESYFRVIVDLLRRNGDVAQRWHYEDSWISELLSCELTYSEIDPLETHMTVRFREVTPEWVDQIPNDAPELNTRAQHS